MPIGVMNLTVDIVIFLQSLRNAFLDFFFSSISFLGEQYVYIFFFGIFYYTYDKKMGEFLAITLALSATVNTIIKNIVGAPRPFEKYPDLVENLRPETAVGNSFPSGHTQNFSTVIFGLSFYKQRLVLFYSATVLVALMMLSRMYLGVHFLEDVLVATLLGIVIAYFLYKLFNKYYEHPVVLHRIYLTIILLALPFVIFIDGEDFFKSYGLLIGVVLGIMIEKKYINFTVDVKLTYKILRVFFGLIVMILVQQGFKIIFGMVANEGSDLMNILDMIRYFLIAITGFGIYPLLFKKFNF